MNPKKSKALAKATDKTPPPRAVVVSVNMPGMQPGEKTDRDFGGMVSEQKGLRNYTIHGMRCISKIQNDI